MSKDPFGEDDFSPEDPFNDDVPNVVASTGPEVHIRIQQRTTKKCLTLVQGLPEKLNLTKVLHYFKKNCCCNGSIVEDERNGQKILQLSGDQRKAVQEFLIKEKICNKDQVVVHGVL